MQSGLIIDARATQRIEIAAKLPRALQGPVRQAFGPRGTRGFEQHHACTRGTLICEKTIEQGNLIIMNKCNHRPGGKHRFPKLGRVNKKKYDRRRPTSTAIDLLNMEPASLPTIILPTTQ